MKRFRIECGVSKPSTPDTIGMDVQGEAKNVNLRIDYITRAMLSNVPDLLIDLLEVAAYIYCADQRLGRGSDKLTNFGENWRRSLHFSISVRLPEVWQHSDVQKLLAETLGFLSDDSYSFDFRRADVPAQPRELYFPNLIDASMEHDEIALFSGGVDLFAGAVDNLVANGKSVTLVGHYSSSKVQNVQKTLIDGLKQRGFDRSVSYVPVWVTNQGVSAREFTQRTRSFLFACLGLVIARMSGKDSFNFYENGIVSINPPLAGDVIGGRATRSTHPKVLRGLEALFSTLLDRSISDPHPSPMADGEGSHAEDPRRRNGGSAGADEQLHEAADLDREAEALWRLLAMRRPPLRDLGSRNGRVRACRTLYARSSSR